MPSPRSLRPLEPIGTRLMTSTPQATATSTTPPATSAVAEVGGLLGRAALGVDGGGGHGLGAARRLSQAVRAMLKACSPTWLTQPPTTWPTSAGSMPGALDGGLLDGGRAGRRGGRWTGRRRASRRGCGRLRRSRHQTWAQPIRLAAGTTAAARRRRRPRARAAGRRRRRRPRRSSRGRARRRCRSGSPVANRVTAPAKRAPSTPMAMVPRQPRLGAPTARRARPPAMRPTMHHARIPIGRDGSGVGAAQAAERPLGRVLGVRTAWCWAAMAACERGPGLGDALDGPPPGGVRRAARPAGSRGG